MVAAQWIQIGLWVLGIYASFCAIFYFAQDLFFFRPERLPHWFKYKYSFPFDEVNFTMEDGGTVNGIHFKVPNAKGVVFYIKGNSRSIKGWGKFAKDFVGKGFDFFIIDYRGFGKSTGKRTEQILYADLQQVYQWLEERYGQEHIVLYGRSLGSGLATRIASWNRPAMLILDSAYFSFRYHINRYGFFLPIKWILRYHIRTDLFIKKVKAPIYLIHGTHDRLIPHKQSVMLRDLAPEQITLVSIVGAKHNNLPDYPEYHEVLYAILFGELEQVCA
jgi:alpha-beta hydrolase superfamily lysophospholipase